MDIRFVSTLTAEDENALAPAILSALGSLLDRFSLPYTVRIETTGARVFQHSHPSCGESASPAPARPPVPRLTVS
jgi:hypothetical protein